MSLIKSFSRKARKMNKDIATWGWRSNAAKLAREFHEKKLKRLKEERAQ